MSIAEILAKAKDKRVSMEFNSVLSSPDHCIAVRFRRDHLYIDVVFDLREKDVAKLIAKQIDEFAARCGYLEKERLTDVRI